MYPNRIVARTQIRRAVPLVLLLFFLSLSLLVLSFFPFSQPVSAQAGGNVYIPIVSGKAGPDAPEPPIGSAPTSTALIRAAETAGAITHEQALQYSVFALYGDARLPAQFKGSMDDDSMVMAHVRAEWNTLSAATKTSLAPYLLPPTAPGSWLNAATAAVIAADADHAQAEAGADPAVVDDAIIWHSIDSAQNVRIWYQTRHAGDDVKAAQVRDAIESRIYPELEDLMGKEWLPDSGLPDNGGTSWLDIYLVRNVKYRGLATPYVDCQQTPIWINVNSDRPIGDDTHAGIVQTVAHEMLHAIHFSYPLKEACATYDWLAEATAKWFEHHVYRDAQSEHPYARLYLDTTYWPLENIANDRHYGAYVYFLHVVESSQRPSVARRAWENAATMDSLKAVAEGGGDYAHYWGDFAVNNWNRDADSPYQQWDALRARAQPHGSAMPVTPGSPIRTLTIPVKLDHMSIQYYHYTFADDAARAITFFNGVTHDMSEQPDKLFADDLYPQGDLIASEQRRNIEVRALYKIAGDTQWKSADWTLDERVTFCRDKADERLEELVIVLANGEYDKASPSYTFERPDSITMLAASNFGCWQWKGTLEVTSVGTSWDHFKIDVPEIVLERKDDWAAIYRLFDVKSGHGTIDFSHEDPEQCGGSATYTQGPQPFTINAGNVWSESLLKVPLAVTSGPRTSAYTGEIASNVEVNSVWECDDDPEQPGRERYDTTTPVGRILVLPGWFDEAVMTTSDGSVLNGDYVHGSYKYTLNLHAVREPTP